MTSRENTLARLGASVTLTQLLYAALKRQQASVKDMKPIQGTEAQAKDALKALSALALRLGIDPKRVAQAAQENGVPQ